MEDKDIKICLRHTRLPLDFGAVNVNKHFSFISVLFNISRGNEKNKFLCTINHI